MAGGKTPSMRHSTIERPLSVSRVMPPTRIIAKTSAKSTISQTRTAPRDPRRARSITPVWTCGFSLVSTSSKMLLFWLIPPSVWRAT